MRVKVGFVGSLLCVLALTTPVSGQEVPENQLPSMPTIGYIQEISDLHSDELFDKMVELDAWVKDYTIYSKWYLEWRNRTEPGFFARWKDHRLDKPSPPSWLASDCKESIDTSGRMYDACQLYQKFAEDFVVTLLRESITNTVKHKEALIKTKLWERFYVDGAWIRPEFGRQSNQTYGLFGAHISIDIGEGIGLFAGPGVIVVRVPNAFGGHDMKPSPDYGITFKIHDFRMGESNVATRLSFSLVEVWIIGVVEGNVPYKANLTLAGFSVSWVHSHP